MFEIVQSSKEKKPSFLKTVLYILGGLVLMGLSMAVSIIIQTPSGTAIANFASWVFSTSSSQIMWYITRSAGFTAYLVLWFSVATGLAVSSKFLDKLLHRAFTFDFHEFLSLLAIGFTILHIGVLLVDRYLPYSVAEILVPFISPYRPVWVGIGVLGFYLMVLVTVTFYLRSRIGMKAFRAIHVLSLVSYLGVAVHGLFSGTDSSLPSVLFMYAFTFLSVAGLMVYYLVQVGHKKPKPIAGKLSSLPVTINRR